MPVLERRLRRRRVVPTEPGANVIQQAVQLMHAAGEDAEAWSAIRVSVLRAINQAGRNIRTDQAARIFAVFQRRPGLLPGLPPAEVAADDSR